MSEKRANPMLPIGQKEKRFALLAARQALQEYLEYGVVSEYPTSSPCLLQHRGSFVTLRLRESGELRGCRGECRPYRPLIESVIRQAISSAIDDCRFSPVTEDELPRLTIRISALSQLQRIRPDEIVLGRHGLMVIQGHRSGLLLPEVPKRFGLQTPAEFLEALLRKAGMTTESSEQEELELLAFETEAWDEGDLIPSLNLRPDW
jgi:AmmeMemoRadiSam system protein A